MKTISTYQEILFMMNTSFAARDLAMKDEKKQQELTPKQRLEDACWSGLIPEILPEIAEKKYDDRLSLLEINEGNNFLDLRYGQFEEVGDDEASINPYVFMEAQSLN